PAVWAAPMCPERRTSDYRRRSGIGDWATGRPPHSQGAAPAFRSVPQFQPSSAELPDRGMSPLASTPLRRVLASGGPAMRSRFPALAAPPTAASTVDDLGERASASRYGGFADD